MKLFSTFRGVVALSVLSLFCPSVANSQTPSACAGSINLPKNATQSLEKATVSPQTHGSTVKTNNQDGIIGGDEICFGTAHSQTHWSNPFYGQRGCFVDLKNISAAVIKIKSLNQAIFRPVGFPAALTVQVYRTISANTFEGHQLIQADWTQLTSTVISDLPARNFGDGSEPDYRLLTFAPVSLAPGQSMGFYVVADIGAGGAPICCNTVGDGAITNTFSDGTVLATGGNAECFDFFGGLFGINGIWMGEVNWSRSAPFSAPSNLGGFILSSSKVSLNWTYNNGCDGLTPDYAYLEYSRKNGATWLPWLTLPLPGAPNTALLSSLQAGKTYRWRVRARYPSPTGPIFLVSNPPYPQFTMPAGISGGDEREKNDLTEADLMLSPNPSDGQTWILFPSESALNLRVFNLDGQLILEEKKAENLVSGQFELQSMQTGVYLIAVTTSAGVFSKKLIVH